MFGVQLFPNQASTAAAQVDQLFLFMLVVTGSVTLLIAAAIIYFGVKYHRRSEDEIPPQIVGSDRLEFAWTIVPLGMFMVFFFWGASIYLNNVQPPSNSMQVYVVAKQWMWKFEHEEGQQEINELHVPIGRPVKLTMTSQDVIHSFFVPDFRIKQDVLPDRYTVTWFQATKTGTYHIFCSQYCGTDHAEMVGTVIVMDPSAFEQWLSGGASAAQSPAAVGQQLFQQYGCSSCHQPNGHGPGPSMIGVFGSTVQLEGGQTVVADENYVLQSILDPGSQIVQGFKNIMPSFRGRLTEEQLLALVAYIRSIGVQPGASGTSSSAPSSGTPAVKPTP